MTYCCVLSSSAIMSLIKRDVVTFLIVLLQDECQLNVSQALVYKLILQGKPADERMGRPPLRNTRNKGTEVKSVVSKDRRQKVRYLAERTG